MARRSAIPVIDLFAGPGGLGEGFSALQHSDACHPFRVALSVEKERTAWQTLRLRAFFRQFPAGRAPEEYYEHLRGSLTESELFARFSAAAEMADAEAVHGTLGGNDLPPDRLNGLIRRALRGANAWVLIGGPPCQAYSLAGRSRNRGVDGYRLEHDQKHRLYQEYLRIVADHWPPFFVMENVRGLLSVTVGKEGLFEKICGDLGAPAAALGRRKGRRYRILSLEPGETSSLFGSNGSLGHFVVRAESHGVPQRRHRVILLGVREDLGDLQPRLPVTRPMVAASAVLRDLPALRSGLSGQEDSDKRWVETFRDIGGRRWLNSTRAKRRGEQVRRVILETISSLEPPAQGRGKEFVAFESRLAYERPWFIDPRLGGACNFTTRAHMPRDLHRYLYAAAFAKVNGESPRLRDFPSDLLPAHVNVGIALDEGRFFNDRFRVQLESVPATTITSHIHKDGHYYIHYDPSQCRSLTVREAARLQTFPDNYFFVGPRTRQYTQVGNAVPPLLAREIASVALDLLVRSGMIA